MRKAIVALALLAGLPAAAQAQVPLEPAATVAARQYQRPPRALLIRTQFQPWSRPTPAQVSTIINVEAARTGASPAGLARRIHCESGFHWWANNGQYNGLGQFADSTFYRGMSTIGSRRVRLVVRRERPKRVLRVDTMTDGTVRRTWRWPIHQRVIHVYSGTIPADPVVTHGWAQVRIMAEALVGRSAVHDSEWECGA